MKEEKLLYAMDGIGDDLISSAMEPVRKKSGRIWFRLAAAAACLCLMLVSPVGAAMVDSITKFMNNGRLEFIIDERLRIQALTPEALAAFPDEEGQTNHVTMDTIADAEEFLGIDLPDNPVLENSAATELHWETEDGGKWDSHCILQLSTGDKPEPYCVDATAAYWVNGMLVHVMYRLPTERNPYENGGGVGFDTEKYDGSEYTAEDGRIWNIYIQKDRYGGGIGYALSKVDGALTWVQVLGASRLLSNGEIEAQLIEIAEAYE